MTLDHFQNQRGRQKTATGSISKVLSRAPIQAQVRAQCIVKLCIRGRNGQFLNIYIHPRMSLWLNVVSGGGASWSWVARDVTWKGVYLPPAPLFFPYFPAAMR